MLKFALKRVIEAFPTLFLVITVTFFMVRLAPGDPFANEKLPQAVKEKLTAHYQLDAPIWQQYLNYLQRLAKGDLGPTFRHPGWGVNELIADRIPISLELGFWSLLIALVLGIFIGCIASLKPNTWCDYLPMSAAMIGICLPTFVIGPLLIYIFGLKLEWTNVWGWVLPSDRILPSFILGLYFAAYVARLMRGSMLETLHQDYIRTAQAKGLSHTRIYGVHAMRNALPPVVSFMGPAAAGLVSGSFVVESLFQIPGLGQLFVESALNNDYSLILGLVIFYATLIIGFNLLVDLLQAVLNPKIRHHA